MYMVIMYNKMVEIMVGNVKFDFLGFFYKYDIMYIVFFGLN